MPFNPSSQLGSAQLGSAQLGAAAGVPIAAPLWALTLGSLFSLTWQSFGGPFPWDLAGSFSLTWASPPLNATWTLDLAGDPGPFGLSWTIPAEDLSPWVIETGGGFALAWTPTAGGSALFWPIYPAPFQLSWDVPNLQPNGWHVDLSAPFDLRWVVDSGATGGKCVAGPGIGPTGAQGVRNYVF